ncbi:MAG TPA: hypothetical protein VIC59_08285 [Gemmatimonadota bacterium]
MIPVPSLPSPLLPLPLYIGPDQFLPLTSALGAIAGLVLMFWTRVKAFFHGLFGSRKKDEAKPTPGPDGN